jgi:hypothetical protein
MSFNTAAVMDVENVFIDGKIEIYMMQLKSMTMIRAESR